jgi:hypothetical protein
VMETHASRRVARQARRRAAKASRSDVGIVRRRPFHSLFAMKKPPHGHPSTASQSWTGPQSVMVAALAQRAHDPVAVVISGVPPLGRCSGVDRPCRMRILHSR